MELYGFALGRHLHFLERLKCINAFSLAGINLLHAPPNLVPKRRVKLLRVFLLMNGHNQVLVEHEQVLQRQVLHFLLNLLCDGCHTDLFYCFLPHGVNSDEHGPSRRLRSGETSMLLSLVPNPDGVIKLHERRFALAHQCEGVFAFPPCIRARNTCMKQFTAMVHRGKPEEGGFWATCLEVPGANGQGETKDECLQNLSDAIQLMVETEREEVFRLDPNAEAAKLRLA